MQPKEVKAQKSNLTQNRDKLREAQEMKKLGVPISVIAKTTGLTPKQIISNKS